MARHRHLPNAPITEAVFDIRVKPKSGFVALTFDAHRGLLPDAYTKSELIHSASINLQVEAGKPPTAQFADQSLEGYRYTAVDGLLIAQFRVDGFTLSRLAPYTNWDEIIEEAEELWAIYRGICEPEEVTRIATRFINRIPLPPDRVKDFSPFLTAPVPIPPNVPVQLNDFLTRIVVTEPTTRVTANLIQAIQGAQAQDVLSVILDIDVYEIGAFSTDPTVLFQRFDALRAFKNTLFFGSLTEEAVDLFK